LLDVKTHSHIHVIPVVEGEVSDAIGLFLVLQGNRLSEGSQDLIARVLAVGHAELEVRVHLPIHSNDVGSLGGPYSVSVLGLRAGSDG